MDKEFSNIRIVDIAKMAGVSVGTVDRVIHNRGRVSEENRKKVQAILEMVNYQPNLMARSLASKKQYHFIAITPSFAQGEYWEAISEGIDKAASEMGSYNITITKLFFDQYDNKTFDDIVRNLLDKKVDGVLIATLFTDSVIRLSRELDRFEIPYIYVDSNIEGQHQLAYFGTESYDAGVIAARLLTDRISPASDILMARIIHSGKNDSNQGRNRREGFCRYLKEMRFTGSLHEVELKINDSVYNFTKLDEIFESNPNIEGAVIFNSTCYILGNYLKARAMQSVKLVGYDLIERNTQLLSEGVITALVAQRPERQGYEGIKSLCNHLLFKQHSEMVNLMPIDILLKENLKYYLNNNINFLETMNELFNVKDKVVVITGGAGILGKGIAAYLAKEGAKVVVLDRSEEAGKALVDSIKAEGNEAMFLYTDVMDKEVLEGNKVEIMKAYGRIDVLLNAAGGNMAGATIAPDKTFFDLQIDAFKKVVDLNLFGTVLPTMVFAEIMVEQKKGSIVNFCSESALRPLTRVVGYGAAKAAIANFTKYMAGELALKFGNGLRVNAIAPGFFLTEQNRTLLTNPDGSLTDRSKTILAHTPFNRFGEPEDLYGTIHYLISDASNFVTGTVAVIDGGFDAFSI